MGKLVDMQKAQDQMTISKLRKQNSKPKLNISGFKDLATLIGPNAKKYKLSRNQKNFQIKGRITIATVATILAIGGGTVIANSVNNDSPTNAIETQAPLQKDDLLNEANDKLFDYTLGSNRDSFDNYYITYQHDNDGGSTTLFVVTEKNISRQTKSKETVFKYTNNLSFDSFQNAKEISSLMNSMIDVNNSDKPTQKQLEELRESLDSLEDKNFKLEGNRIVAVDEKSNDYER